MGLPPSVRAAIGGRWAVSWVALAILVPLEVVLWAADATPGAQPTWAAGLALAAATIAMVFVADRTVFRNRREHPVPVWWVAAFGAAVWAVEAGLRMALGNPYVADAADPLQVALAIGARALLGAITWPLLSLVLATYDAFVRDRDALMEAAVRLDAEALRESGSVRALRSVLHESESAAVESALTASRDALDSAAAGDEKAAEEASHMLRAVATDIIRPASHRLWESGNADGAARRARPWSVLVRGLRTHPVPLGQMVGAYATLMLLAMLGRAGTGPGGAVPPVASIAGVAGVYLIGALVLRVAPRHPMLVGGATIVAAGTVAGLITQALLPGDELRLAVVHGVVVAAIGLATSFTLSALDTREEILDALRDDVDAAEVRLAAIRRAEANLERDFAAHLHETIQARVIAASYAVDDARRGGDPLALGRAVAQAREALDVPVDEARTAAEDDLAAMRQAVDTQWRDIMAITWHVDAGDLGPADVRCLHQLLDQALVNAMVHGGATHAEVAITRCADAAGVGLRVTDDGRGPQGGAAGGGSRMLDAATACRWQLVGGAHGGATLTATVPTTGAGYGGADHG